MNNIKPRPNIPKPRPNIPKPRPNIPKPRLNIPKPRLNIPKPRLNIAVGDPLVCRFAAGEADDGGAISSLFLLLSLPKQAMGCVAVCR